MTSDAASEPLLKLLERARKAGIRLEPAGGKLRFEAPAQGVDPALFEELAANRDAVIAFLKRARTPVDPPLPPREGPDPLSASQLQLWLLEQRDGLGATYHLPMLLTLREMVDPSVVEAALERIVARHASLRTVFAPVEGMPVAVTLPEPSAVRLEWVAGREGLLAVAQRPFDLVAGPLFRAAIAPAGRGCEMLLCVHHIVADGQSMAILGEELLDLLTGRQLAPVPEWRFADFARWQGSDAVSRADALEVVAAAFDGHEPLFPFPTDHPRPPCADFAGGSRLFALPAALGVARLAAKLRVSPLDVMLAAWTTALTRAAGEHSLVLGLVESGRPFPALGRVVGNFATLVPVPLRFSAGDSFAERIDIVSSARRAMQPAAQLPFLEMVRRLSPGHRGNFNPLVQHAVAANDFARPVEMRTGIEIGTLPLGVSRFDTLLSYRRRDEVIEGELEFASALYEEPTMARLCDRFAGILVSGTNSPDEQANALDRRVIERIAPAPSRDAKRCEAAGPWPDVLLATARTDPARTAIIFGEERVDYGTLARQTTGVAAALEASGAEVGTRVGVSARRGSLLPAALLGIWRIGAAYVPLDPEIPPSRLGEMVHAAGVSVVLADDPSLFRQLERRGPVLALDAAAAARPSGYRIVPIPEAVAYVMHSSGSTGKPKPIAVPHRAIANFVGWCGSAYSREELAEVLAITGIGFDISLFELLAPLAAGTVIRIDDGAILRLEAPIPDSVTLLNTVPSIAAALVEAHPLPRDLRTVNLAGEPLPPVLVERLHTLRPGLRVNNLYGPTEATIYATAATVSAGERVTIGDSIAGARISLLDERQLPVANGDPGEIAIGGPLIATGYPDDPARTAANFVPDPDGPPGSRRYLTGDRARRVTQGLLFLGRRDRQVKVNGVRIELGDVEAALAALPGVVDAAALVLPTGRGGAMRLTALVAVGGRPCWDRATMRARLAECLPGYMLPQLFPVDALPRLANGKLDRSRMAEIVAQAESGTGPETVPKGEIEMALAEEWARILGAGVPARTDHFFGSGGDSLGALRLVHALRERLSAELPPTLVFARPIFADLAVAVAEAPRTISREELLLGRIAAMSDTEVAAMLRAIEGEGGGPDFA